MDRSRFSSLREGIILNFKDVMSLVPSSVSILACIGDGKIYGCTISSFVSVNVSKHSAEVIFVLKKGSLLGSKIIDDGVFTINVLNSNQELLARKYSSKRDPEELPNENWSIASSKFPRLSNSRASFNCEYKQVYKDHEADIFVSRVSDFSGNRDLSALVYDSRKYGMF
jgi:flavin reductase (DIM6/NTAB) family NADH-FMN oxidoreductase RutF